MDENLSSEIRDTLPDDLNAVENRAEYRFPDNSRRRIPGIIYVISGALVLVWNLTSGD